MAVADITRIQKRVVQLLNARSSDVNYSASPSGKNTAFLSTQEITDAILEADAMVVIQGILASVDHPLRAAFLVASANLASGAAIPECVGPIGRVDLSQDGSTWTPGIWNGKDDVLMGRMFTTTPLPYTQTSGFIGYYNLSDNSIYHTSTHARIYLPQFTRTSACQAHEGLESAIIAGAIMLLKKDSSNAEHDYYQTQFFNMLPIIRAGSLNVQMPMVK
jgi:hypothetical protein